MIGINSAMMPIGILLFSPVIPVVSKRFGSRNVAIIAALLTAVFVIAFKVFDTLEAWFVIRLFEGMSVSILFVLSEAWIVGYSGSQHRGKIVAIYASVLSVSFGAGPAIVGWIGIEGWTPFVIGSVVILAGVIPLSLIQESPTEKSEEASSSGFFEILSRAPVLFATVGAFAIFDAAILALLPVYGIQTGLSVSIAATALSVLMIGNILLQFPLGWMADRMPHRLLLAGCALVTVLMLLVLPLVMTTFWMWPALVVIGSTGYGVYTVALTSLGNRFSGQELIEGSAGFAVIWGMGALFGSVSAGWAMSGFGPHGLPVYIAAVYLLLAISLGIRGRYEAAK
jgi:MFS family permease